MFISKKDLGDLKSKADRRDHEWPGTRKKC
jgi:hypothetical protein